MSNNEKLRTEDIIEIYDGKIITSEGHPEINVIPREPYSSVLNKICPLLLSVEEKEAFNNTLTTPSALNPVVLKEDLTTYIPEFDLGNVKDSVNLFSQLPLPFTAVGSTESGNDHVTIISSIGVIKKGDLITSMGSEFDSNTVVVDIISTTDIQILPSALLTNTNFTLTFSPVEGDLRAVLSDGIIYRWNGTAWMPFIHTGTMEHPELNNQNGNPDYQHLTSVEKTTLLTDNHTHSNKLVLDGILASGSGSIITTSERNRLPTQNQKDALVGTSGTPNGSNPYVTHSDPRLDTVRNPYVTIGLPNSLATFQGVDYRPFEDAILAIDIGAASAVKAIEILEGEYDLSSVPIIWTKPSGILIEGFTPQTVTLSFQTGSTSGIKVTDTGGSLIVRGLTIELNGQNTSGIYSTRENTLIEDCIFRSGDTPDINQVGIILLGQGSIVRRCKFEGQLTKGVSIKAANCRIESCTFDLTLSTNSGISAESGADYTMVDHNFFMSGIVNVQSGVSFVNIINNRFASILDYITDSGSGTRYLENQPEDINQPFIGKKRTVGTQGTYADFRGNDEIPIIAALNDPNTTEVEILEGDYTINNTITIPEGKTLRGVRQGIETNGVTFISNNVTLLKLSHYSKIENINVIGENVILVDTDPSIANAIVDHCIFNLTAVNDVSQYELNLNSSIEWVIRNSIFKGVRGIQINGATLRSRILNNIFSNIDMPLSMENLNENNQIKDNHFTVSAPNLAGNQLLIEHNHFLGDVPTKINTSNSIWQGNYPHPEANNDTGIDTMVISLDRYLEAVNDGASRSIISSCGSLSFAEDQIGISATLPIDLLKTKVDKTKTYTVRIYWTSVDGLTGDVVWRVTPVWKDSNLNLLGTSDTVTVISERTKLVSQEEDIANLTFTNYGISSNPTHVSVTVERVGDEMSDTLAGSAHVLEVCILIPRD